MKILLITDNFYPETNALANRSTIHANFWKKNDEVFVITCFPNHPTGKKFRDYDRFKFLKKEKNRNITIYRIWSFISKKNNSYLNFFDYLSFGLTSFLFSFFLKCDLIVASSPPLPVAFFSVLAAKFKKIKVVTEVRDLWVDSISDLKISKSKFLIKVLRYFENLMLKQSNLIVCTTNSIKEKIIKKKITNNKILIRPNGSGNLDSFKKEINLKNFYKKNKLNILYFGTIGIAQNFKIIFSAIKNFENKVNLVILGNGSELKNVEFMINSNTLKNVKLIELREFSIKDNIYKNFDVGISSLKNNKTFKTVVPSKIYDYASNGLTTLFIGPKGDASNLIKTHSLGLYSKTNIKDLSKKLKQLISNKKYFKTMAKRQMLKNKKLFDRKNVAKLMLNDFKRILKNETSN